MLPPAFDVDRAMTDVHWLVEEVGPRSHLTDEEQAAATGVATRLSAAGWTVDASTGSPLACRGKGSTLFLAHVDSFPDSPGAVDNAGAVAVLLELARSTEATDLCLGFPLGEEAGLIGSHKMVRYWPGPTLPSLVVSLDLIGDGVPTAADLEAPWGTEALTWLVSNTDIDVPLIYRAFGRGLPQHRSDHGWFADAGVPAFLLFDRGPAGVFTRYHQPSDTTVDPAALEATAAVLEGIATHTPIPPSDTGPAVVLGRWVLPGWSVWTVIAAGLVSALADIRQWLSTAASLLRAILTAGIVSIAVVVITRMGLEPTEAERTAAAVMGIPATGWWAAAPIALGVGWIIWGLLRWRIGAKGSAPLAAGILTGSFLSIDPILALPFAVGALLVRIHPLLGILPTFFFLRPSVLRELSFHGLLAPTLWGLLWLTAWPAFGRRHR